MVTTLTAFLLALGVLIAVHEWGHYRMAVACGVRVLRFSVGFGPSVWRYVSPASGVEFVLGAFPLGGYVRMLDEREAPVPPEQRHLAFNTQPLRSRALIVAAGPAANLLLAVILYSAVHWMGMEQAAPVLPTPPVGSLAQAEGLVGGETVVAAGLQGQEPTQVQSFEDVRWWITQAVLKQENLELVVRRDPDAPTRSVILRTASLEAAEINTPTFLRVGLAAPRSAPLITEVVAGDPADRAGVKAGDTVVAVDGLPVSDAADLRARIRASASAGDPAAQQWQVERASRLVDLRVVPRLVQEGASRFGRVGASIGGPVQRVVVRHGFWEGLALGAQRVWDVGALSLRMMGRMLVGEASLKNISGPVSIADYAGKSASAGFENYLVFLALISVSLGVLNLLPIPVLDGGHLMYYLWEWLTGAPPSPTWLDGLQRVGVALMAGIMVVALWNDVNRLLQ